MRDLRAWCVVAVGFLGSNFAVSAAELVGTPQERLLKDIQYLSSDELEGRGVGTKGLDLAADYILKSFSDAGLKVNAVNGGAFHKFEMTTGARLKDVNVLKLTGPEGKELSFELDKDFSVMSFGGQGKFSGGIVFAGYGINSKEPKDAPYNDFDGIDIKGKIVIVMRRNPQQENPKGPFRGPNAMHAAVTAKLNACVNGGAAAMVLVNEPYSIAQEGEKKFDTANNLIAKFSKELLAADANSDAYKKSREQLADALKKLDEAGKVAHAGGEDVLLKLPYAGYGKDGSIPVVHITAAKCNELLQAAIKKSLKDIEAEIDSRLKPQTVELKGWTATGETNVERVRSEVKNVLAVLEGEGPLADETIVVGAHYDHVGRGGEGSLAPGSKEIHNGADDNASGSVALLEVARRLAARKEKLPRRVVFIAFTAEELGLIGSAKYVENPAIPLDKTIAMFNMDMVGRLTDDALTVYGVGTSPTFKDELTKLNESRNFKLVLKPEGQGPSDQTSFYMKKIPVLHFFTGTHSDYHRPSDDWEKINVPGMDRITGMVEDLVVQTAVTEKRPAYVEVKGTAQINRGGNRPYVGTIPNFGSEEKGYAISGAAPGSPADVAGLKGGDRIVKVGSHNVSDLNDFDSGLRNYSAGEVVDFTVIREGKEVVLKLKLAAPR